MKNKNIVEALITIYHYMMEQEDCGVLCMYFLGRIIRVEMLEEEE